MDEANEADAASKNSFLPLTTKEKALASHALRKVDRGDGRGGKRFTWAKRGPRETAESRHASLLVESPKAEERSVQEVVQEVVAEGLRETKESLLSDVHKLVDHNQRTVLTRIAGTLLEPHTLSAGAQAQEHVRPLLGSSPSSSGCLLTFRSMSI